MDDVHWARDTSVSADDVWRGQKEGSVGIYQVQKGEYDGTGYLVGRQGTIIFNQNMLGCVFFFQNKCDFGLIMNYLNEFTS